MVNAKMMDTQQPNMTGHTRENEALPNRPAVSRNQSHAGPAKRRETRARNRKPGAAKWAGLNPNERLRPRGKTLYGLPLQEPIRDGDAEQNPSPDYRRSRSERRKGWVWFGGVPPAGANGMSQEVPEQKGETR